MLFDIAVSLILSALSGMGVGGGGLLVYYLTLIRNFPQLTAQGINLAFFSSASFSSSIVNLFKRHVNFNIVIIMAALGVMGAMLGMYIAESLSPDILRKILGGVLIVGGIKPLFSKAGGK